MFIVTHSTVSDCSLVAVASILPAPKQAILSGQLTTDSMVGTLDWVPLRCVQGAVHLHLPSLHAVRYCCHAAIRPHHCRRHMLPSGMAAGFG